MMPPRAKLPFQVLANLLLILILLLPLTSARGTNTTGSSTDVITRIGIGAGISLAVIGAGALIFAGCTYVAKRRLRAREVPVRGFLRVYVPPAEQAEEGVTRIDMQAVGTGSGANRLNGTSGTGASEVDAPPAYESRVRDEVLAVGVDLLPPSSASGPAAPPPLEPPPPRYEEVNNAGTDSGRVLETGRGTS